MKKKFVVIIIVIVTLFVILTPCRYIIKDGGSINYSSLIYSVTLWDGMGYKDNEYTTGVTVELFNKFEVYDSFRTEKIQE